VPGGSRLDLLLTKGENEKCFVEIKNCTLVKDGIAYFPDAVTARGRKHLVELQKLVLKGNRCAVFFLVQRMDAKAFTTADHIDPEYGREFRKAKNSGVEVIVYSSNSRRANFVIMRRTFRTLNDYEMQHNAEVGLFTKPSKIIKRGSGIKSPVC
jgi:sugar fermentation stimulation protein